MSDQPPATPMSVAQTRRMASESGTDARQNRPMSCPTDVNINDGPRQRTDRVWTILEDGRVRHLVLRVGRGVVRDIEPREAARELLCQMCERDYPVWYADNDLWNAVMRGGDRAAADEYEYVCPTCFALKADAMQVEGYFRLTPGRVVLP